MDEKILTVTVPSYNVQAYLEDCLESFVNSEVMDDIEVLIVNDGSSDDTATIAERYVSKYENTFRLINKEIKQGTAGRRTWFHHQHGSS